MGAPGLDPTDHQIVRLLVEDARLSTRAIARAVGMSPTGVSERLERLHSRGIILGYHAEVDLAALGWGVEAIIGITADQRERLRALADHLMEFPEVVSAQVVTGRWDVLASVRTRSHQALQELVVGRLPTVPGFIRGETMVCWESTRRGTGSFLTDHDARLPADDGGPASAVSDGRASRKTSARRGA
jgi:DNA-binding Lrp family transcriptional regulator